MAMHLSKAYQLLRFIVCDRQSRRLSGRAQSRKPLAVVIDERAPNLIPLLAVCRHMAPDRAGWARVNGSTAARFAR